LRGNTALHFAVLRNDVDMVKTLLDLGADKNIKNSIGKTPLDRARNKGFSDISNLLTTYRSAAEPD
jgi:ankyrin repeat protein